MALTTAWDRVSERFHDLAAYHERFAPTTAAMLELVAELRREPRLADVEPSVSLGSLNLKLVDSSRYVMVAWHEDEPQPFKVSFVDPPLEFHDTQLVSKAQVLSTIVDYISRARGKEPS